MIVFGCIYGQEQRIKYLGEPRHLKAVNFKMVPKMTPRH